MTKTECMDKLVAVKVVTLDGFDLSLRWELDGVLSLAGMDVTRTREGLAATASGVRLSEVCELAASVSDHYPNVAIHIDLTGTAA